MQPKSRVGAVSVSDVEEALERLEVALARLRSLIALCPGNTSPPMNGVEFPIVVENRVLIAFGQACTRKLN